MKSILELELTQQIRKVSFVLFQANILFRNEDFSEALESYEECIENFDEYRKQNPYINEEFLLTTKSLMGVCLKNLQRPLQAEIRFDQVLKVQPYHMLTIFRKIVFLIQNDRLSQSIEELQKVVMCDPQNENVPKYIIQITENIKNINDEFERERLFTLVKNIKSDYDEGDTQEQRLSFISLKKIDRFVQKDPEQHHKRSVQKKCSIFEIQNMNNQDENDLTQQMEKSQGSMSIIRKKSVKGKQKRSVLKIISKMSSSVSKEYTDGNEFQEYSIKNIDEKMNSSQKVSQKFVSFSNMQIQIHQPIEASENLNSQSKKTEKKQRKSCLKSENRLQAKQEKNSKNRRNSSFRNLKNIDKMFCGQMKDENNEQHSIYNWQNKQLNDEELLVYLKPLQNMMNTVSNKKQSILKRQSGILSKRSLFLEEDKKVEKKKSVCFIAGPQ